MEDRYLYKAKRKDNGKWVVGYYAVIGERKVIIEKCVENYYCPDTCESRHGNQIHEVNSKTICQCTGLKDKNGKLIWENDIVVCRDFTEEKYVIAWKQDEACFEYQQYGCSIMNFEQLSGCEVEAIGNIFDNAELLESEE